MTDTEHALHLEMILLSLLQNYSLRIYLNTLSSGGLTSPQTLLRIERWVRRSLSLSLALLGSHHD